MGSMIPVILDAKRGDIASTAEAYAKSAFETLGAHCITLSPYLGKDSIEPFIQNSEKGVFLLCKTSNPGSGDLQDLMVTIGTDGQSSTVYLYEHVARLAQHGTPKTTLASSSAQRMWMPCSVSVRLRPICGSWLPASAPRAGSWKSALKAGLRKDGKGMLIHVSRVDRARRKAWAGRGELRDEILAIQSSISADR